jgi:hypothetical protein
MLRRYELAFMLGAASTARCHILLDGLCRERPDRKETSDGAPGKHITSASDETSLLVPDRAESTNTFRSVVERGQETPSAT